MEYCKGTARCWNYRSGGSFTACTPNLSYKCVPGGSPDDKGRDDAVWQAFHTDLGKPSSSVRRICLPSTKRLDVQEGSRIMWGARCSQVQALPLVDSSSRGDTASHGAGLRAMAPPQVGFWLQLTSHESFTNLPAYWPTSSNLAGWSSSSFGWVLQALPSNDKRLPPRTLHVKGSRSHIRQESLALGWHQAAQPTHTIRSPSCFVEPKKTKWEPCCGL